MFSALTGYEHELSYSRFNPEINLFGLCNVYNQNKNFEKGEDAQFSKNSNG